MKTRLLVILIQSLVLSLVILLVKYYEVNSRMNEVVRTNRELHVDNEVLNNYADKCYKQGFKEDDVLNDLYTVSRLKINDLVSTGYWSHDNSDGCDLKCRLENMIGDDIEEVGESLYHGECDIRTAISLWEQSPAHKELLDEDYRSAILLVTASEDDCYITLTMDL